MLSPWDRFAPATLEFCENLLDGWIRQPANTYSNIGFIIVGILLWRKTPPTKPHLRIFSIGALLVGVFSSAYHLSMTFVAQIFDVASMFMTAGILVVLNMMRLGWLPLRHLYTAFVGMLVGAILAMVLSHSDVGEWIFTGQVTFVVLSEVGLILKRRPPMRSYRWWLASIPTYLVATLAWIMDIKKVWCDADNHWFNGHAVWHLLNAVVVLFLYRFYEEAMSAD